MNVVRLVVFRNRELVAVCKDLLALAESGEAQGLAFVVKLKGRTHRAGLAGDYGRSPAEALSAATRLQQKLLQDQDEEETESGT